ncbi:hypothetical protein EJ065_6555 [Corallococcus coralloides]|uniref:Restriction endonuclease type IV Mrr domain-containing protein n=1 Tax=Corallococcus coralloides TaxID=184914 RepID=A0A410S1T4_CORCK|nr:hypothetical protein [Corallococcus coralloides]QAT88083.1 hypothetical protein EJ065_6555 [Corallococcus coralloides]
MPATRHPKPPVLTRPELLPLKDLDWGDFEAFCCDLLNLSQFGRTFVNFGKRGDAQQGIDLLGEDEDGTCWVAQCKQVNEFTANHAKEAVKATVFTANRYLLLISDEARVNVRKVIRAEPDWDLWDVRDISRHVRELPLYKSKRLVEQYFGPHWCEGFLGSPGPSALFSPRDYFARQLDSTRLFHHAWDCVGRDDLLDRLDSLLGQSHDAGVIWGRGGIGKTKLLYEWSRRVAELDASVPLFFIDPQRPLKEEAFHELPPGPCVLVLDDAHLGGPVDSLLSMIRKHPGVRVLLSCRPESHLALRSCLSRANFDVWKTLDLEVPPLSRTDSFSLAQQGLGEQWRHLAEKLTSISADSPLTMVLGARLVSKHGADPRLLSNHEEFKNQLIERFKEILHGTVSPGIDPSLCSRLVQMLSAFAPFNIEDEFARVKACDFLGTDDASLLQSLTALTAVGALHRTGTYLRIVPDLLAEHILEQACVKDGTSTGYAEEAFNRFQGVGVGPLVRNLSALGWRLRQAKKEPPGFLDGIWGQLRTCLRAGTRADQLFALRIVGSVADLDPERALDCAERVLQRLHSEGIDHSQESVSAVLRLAFSTLWAIQESYEPLARHCLDRLWEAGRDDQRPLNGAAQLDHGIGMLCWIARCWPETSVDRYRRILDAINDWLGALDALDHVHSPLPILGALLGKSANIYREGEEGVEFSAFIVDAEQMHPIRKHALDLIQRCARSGRPKVVHDASFYLRKALRNPKPFVEVAPTSLHPWVPEQLEIIERLESLTAELEEPFYRYLFIQTLYPAAHEQMDSRVLERAIVFVSSVPVDFEFRLVHALCSDLLGEPFSMTRCPEGLSACWPAKGDILPVVARELRDRFPVSSTGARFLHERSELLNQLREHSCDAGPLLKEITKQSSFYAQRFCESAIEIQSPHLSRVLPAALSALWNREHTWFHAFARQLMVSGQQGQRNLVAQTYARVGMAYQHRTGDVLRLDDEDLCLLAQLLEDEDPEARNISVFWLEVLDPSHDAWLYAILARFDIHGTPLLPGNWCTALKALHARGELSGERLTPFLRKLLPLQRCSEFAVRKFLVTAAQHDPQQVLEFILMRIEQVGPNVQEGFEPFFADCELGLLSLLGNSPHGASILGDVLTRISRAPDDQRRWLAMLFNALSSDCTSSLGLAQLDKQSRTNDKAAFEAIGWVLSHASVDWVLERQDLTRRILERAHALGTDCQQYMAQRLLERAVNGTKAGEWRSTAHCDEKRLQRALECKRRVLLSSPAHPFYVQLVDQLETVRASFVRKT